MCLGSRGGRCRKGDHLASSSGSTRYCAGPCRRPCRRPTCPCLCLCPCCPRWRRARCRGGVDVVVVVGTLALDRKVGLEPGDVQRAHTLVDSIVFSMHAPILDSVIGIKGRYKLRVERSSGKPASEPAAAEAQLELAVAGGGGGVDCCPAAAACTSTSTGASSSTAGGGAADRLQFERGWATKYATRKKTEPERYSQFDLD